MPHKVRRYGDTRVCSVCQQEKPNTEEFFHRVQKTGYLTSVCRPCDNAQRHNYNRAYHARLRSNRDIESILRLRASEKRADARRRGIEFDLSGDYLIELWYRQNGRCGLSGDEIELFDPSSDSNLHLDRIDPDLGYVQGNVQLVTKRANFARGKMSIDEFVAFCRRVLMVLGALLVLFALWGLLSSSPGRATEMVGTPVCQAGQYADCIMPTATPRW